MWFQDWGRAYIYKCIYRCKYVDVHTSTYEFYTKHPHAGRFTKAALRWTWMRTARRLTMGRWCFFLSKEESNNAGSYGFTPADMDSWTWRKYCWRVKPPWRAGMLSPAWVALVIVGLKFRVSWGSWRFGGMNAGKSSLEISPPWVTKKTFELYPPGRWKSPTLSPTFQVIPWDGEFQRSRPVGKMIKIRGKQR